MKNIYRIVATGGPCAGKTTAFARVEPELSALGFKVFIAPESFTLLYGCGIKLREYRNVEFQDMLFQTQLHMENLLNEAAEKCEEENVLIIYDRGLLDGFAYTAPDDIAEILRRNGQTINSLMNRYDAVIHLITAADGAKEAYLANMKSNKARYETVEEAIATDRALMKVWTGHPHLRIVDNSTDFSKKITRFIAEICAVIGKPAPLEIEKKFLIKRPDIDELAKFVNLSKSEIIQTYLCDDGSGYERRLRMRGIDGDYTFFYTEKRTILKGVRIENERKISAKEYFDLLIQSDCRKRQIQKTRYCFIHDNLYFELDIYPFWEGVAILEIELTSEASKFRIPDFINVLQDVTNDIHYSNYRLASVIPDENL